MIERLPFHVIYDHLRRGRQRLIEGGADDEVVTIHRVVRDIPVPTAVMLQELSNGHRAEARIADGGQIKDSADGLVNGFRRLSINPESLRGSQAECPSFHRAKAPVLMRGSVRVWKMRAESRAGKVR